TVTSSSRKEHPSSHSTLNQARHPSRASITPGPSPSSSPLFYSSNAHSSVSILLALCVLLTSSPFHTGVCTVTGCYVFPPGKTNPCTNQRCLYGAECMPSQDGKTARCQCPSECPNYGDSQGGGPVCGSNGVDYPNMCELRKESCTSMKNIRVKYYGKCDPCQGVSCKEPKVCKVLEPDRTPSCACNIFCPTELNFVCGTDGKTYSNQCLLRQQACRDSRDIRQLYNGKCSPENNPCMRLQCGPMETCSVDKSGRAVCVCPPECEPVLRLVCGNDSNTYDNECELRRRACLDKNYVVVAKQGACGQLYMCIKIVLSLYRWTFHYLRMFSACDGYMCAFGAKCVVHRGRPTCECRQCTEEYDPVCGDNGITYENECKLQQDSCHSEESVSIAKRGACDDSCGEQRCEFYAMCHNGPGGATCVCPKDCVEVHSPVCGNDGVTYANECELRVASCHKRIFLSIASTGSCDKCKGVKCDNYAKCESGTCVCPIICPDGREPVCGTDDRTYKNECEMRKHACAHGKDIQVAFMGECSTNGRIGGSGGKILETMTTTVASTRPPCTVNNCINFGGECDFQGVEYICVCNFKCGNEKNPVCGSDGRMYHNECDMALASCMKKERIKKEPIENCDEAVLSTSKPPITQCSETRFGCCNDGLTPAKAAGGGGCPDICGCNSLGSYSTTCDPITRQCTCKPGVGGKRCDRCQIGYYAMHLIADGNIGCLPCHCHPFGSARDDCNQMSGRCACKPMIMGMKCDICRDGSKPGPSGCQNDESPSSCSDMVCRHGSVCREGQHGPTCSCDLDCQTTSIRHGSGNSDDIVCGTDGQNYGSECELRMFACRLDQNIEVDHTGACKGAPPTPVTTISPVTRSRKTTRHTDGMPGSEETKGDNSQPREESNKECQKRKVGQICLQEECCPTNGYCKGVCECNEGYVASLDDTQCVEVKKVPMEENKNITNACTINPCDAGTCIVDKWLGYRCACPFGREGTNCGETVTITTPSFSGRSHMELPRLEGGTEALSIEVTFTSFNEDGIILFNAKFKNGSGDFVSLAIRHGYLEFRYDLGGGPAILKSRELVAQSVNHRVIAQLEQNRGSLILDNGQQIQGSSPSTHKSLDLNDPLYLGHVPRATEQTFQKIGVNIGLNGCIQSLRAGESRETMRTYNLGSRGMLSNVESGVDIVECGVNPCQSMPCQNDGVCLVVNKHFFECVCKKGYTGLHCETLEDPCATEPCQYGGTCVAMTSSNTFFCQCPEGREGLRCEREAIPEVYVPQFSGDSYMELPMDESLSNSLRITIWFLSTKPDGVLMFATQSPGGEGDFISLNLVNKKLVFTFFLGSGIGVIESKKHIHLDKWHEVTVNRTGRFGQMTIDDHPPVTGEAELFNQGGASSMLNMDRRPLFLGGFRSPDDLPLRAAIKTGFTGAVQKVTINGRTIDGLMASALTMRNISTYNGPPCKVNPCMNGGVCVPALNLADCRCPSNYMGKNCEKRFEQMDLDQPIQFDGMSFISYPNEINNKQEGQKNNHFYVRFRASQPNGVLLLQTGGDTVASDYLLVALDAGHVIFSYNLGKQGPGNLHIIRSEVNVMDGDWHTVRVMRNKRDGTIQVDKESPVTALSEEGTQQLDTDGYLWLGGRNNLPWGLPVKQGLQGCVSEVKINGQSLHLVTDKMPDAMTESTSFTFCADKDGA
ncbi:hypothetical protein EGW08_008421, partial [Elysia chlorotica]